MRGVHRKDQTVFHSKVKETEERTKSDRIDSTGPRQASVHNRCPPSYDQLERGRDAPRLVEYPIKRDDDNERNQYHTIEKSEMDLKQREHLKFLVSKERFNIYTDVCQISYEAW